MRNKLSRLGRIVLAAPIVIASLANLNGCFTYGGKRVNLPSVYGSLRSGEGTGNSETIAKILDYNGDGVIDDKDAEWAKGNLKAAAAGYVISDSFRKATKWVKDRISNMPSLSDQVTKIKPKEE